MKTLSIIFPNGKFKIPVEIIAEDRTTYYSKVDGFSKNSQAWKDEYDFCYNSEYELKDWVLNNMELNDLKQYFEEENNTSFNFDEINEVIINEK